MSPKRRSIFMYVAGLGALAATLLGVWGLGARRSSRAADEARGRTEEQARGPRVRVAPVAQSAPERELVLQGEARPFLSVTLYAKVSGYLTNMRVDKGDRVKARQVIANIASPELDQQYAAATADAKNKRINADRVNALSPSGVVSKQETDLARANADVAEATQASLNAQRDYRTIRAPFDGTVTARFADPGALIQAATNAQTGAVPIVTVSKTDRLRIYVYLDQGSASLVHVGDPALLRVPEKPGFVRKAAITRVAGELAPRTRTMLTEIDVDNADGAILPGSFVRVSIRVKTPPLPEVPVEALVTRQDKAFVPVVDGSGHLRYRAVNVADDDGKSVRLLDGVAVGERVALNVGNEVEDGAQVQVVAPAGPPPGKAAAAPPGHGTGGGAPDSSQPKSRAERPADR
ncbi:MAG TPA: efflux RND transporter periplasmic adaptor subunit [Polyangia bacterium]